MGTALSCSLHRCHISGVLQVNPIFEISPLEPRFSEWLVFEGISVDEFGKQHYLVSICDRKTWAVYDILGCALISTTAGGKDSCRLQDATVAYKRAVLNCIDYLHKFGYTKQQVHSHGHMVDMTSIVAIANIPFSTDVTMPAPTVVLPKR